LRRHTSRPSIESSAGARALGLISSLTTPCPGKIIGLKLSERGAMGVRRRASASGCEIGPPAEREYAVEPVGVERRRPSDWRQLEKRQGQQTQTHHCLSQVLSVKVRVDDGEVWVSPAVQGHLVHHLPPAAALGPAPLEQAPVRRLGLALDAHPIQDGDGAGEGCLDG
jgi:hypothetical protein